MKGNSIQVERRVGNLTVTIVVAEDDRQDGNGRVLPPVPISGVNPNWRMLPRTISAAADRIERSIRGE